MQSPFGENSQTLSGNTSPETGTMAMAQVPNLEVYPIKYVNLFQSFSNTILISFFNILSEEYLEDGSIRRITELLNQNKIQDIDTAYSACWSPDETQFLIEQMTLPEVQGLVIQPEDETMEISNGLLAEDVFLGFNFLNQNQDGNHI